MEKAQKVGLEIYRFSNLSRYLEIDHFISSRAGGYSKGPFQSLNTGFHVGDNDWMVLQNRKKLAQVLGAELDQFTFCNQTHSCNIAVIDNFWKGSGSTDFSTAIPNTDGLVTNNRKIFITVQVADCVPILLYDPVKRVVASVHAGWKGTLRKALQAAVRQMMHTFGTNASDIIAGIGPSNGPCCYEVGEDVKSETIKSLGNTNQILKEHPEKNKYIFDQWHANFLQLKECGVPEGNIEIAGICSQCHSDTFYSSRFDNGITGRYAAGIMIR
ncbi:MAG: peptidoglycan editing factor PgeF [Bacteroidetes bacterium]|nr:MAG: peptidoglycan editing factor PgeF [Bacteroidota bacterium]